MPVRSAPSRYLLPIAATVIVPERRNARKTPVEPDPSAKRTRLNSSLDDAERCRHPRCEPNESKSEDAIQHQSRGSCCQERLTGGQGEDDAGGRRGIRGDQETQTCDSLSWRRVKPITTMFKEQLTNAATTNVA